MELLIRLFIAFLKIGTFSFGGGYAMLPFIQKEIVESNTWISMSEFTDIIGISQMTPGPVAINSATFVGYKVGGIVGGIIATLGVITTSFILITIRNETCSYCTYNICIYRFSERIICRFKKYNNNFDSWGYIIIKKGSPYISNSYSSHIGTSFLCVNLKSNVVRLFKGGQK